VPRSEEYMKALRHAQIREYFFGHGENTLAPSSQSCDYADLHVFQLSDGNYNYYNFQSTLISSEPQTNSPQTPPLPSTAPTTTTPYPRP